MKKLLIGITISIIALTILSFCGHSNETGTFIHDEFPKPIGSYTVGRTQMDFKYNASDNSERELTALFYYPSDSDEGKPTAEYAFPEFHSLRNELMVKIGNKNSDPLFESDFKTWSYEDVALSEKETQYPVLFFSHGAGAYPDQGTLFAQDLASTGYIVVSVGHAETGVSKFIDGRVEGMSEEFMEDSKSYTTKFFLQIIPRLNIMSKKFDEEKAMKTSRKLTSTPEADNYSKYAVLQSEDIRYVADNLYKMNTGDLDSMFEGRFQLDIGLGMFGHSFGGTTAAIVSRDDERFIGSVNYDGNMVGALDSDFKKPFMQLGTVLAYNTNAFLLESNSKDTYFAIVDDVTHSDFSDSLFTGTDKERGERDALEQRDILTSYTKAFFDKYMLKKDVEIEDLEFDGVEMIKKH